MTTLSLKRSDPKCMRWSLICADEDAAKQVRDAVACWLRPDFALGPGLQDSGAGQFRVIDSFSDICDEVQAAR